MKFIIGFTPSKQVDSSCEKAVRKMGTSPPTNRNQSEPGYCHLPWVTCYSSHTALFRGRVTLTQWPTFHMYWLCSMDHRLAKHDCIVTRQSSLPSKIFKSRQVVLSIRQKLVSGPTILPAVVLIYCSIKGNSTEHPFVFLESLNSFPYT